jgi:glycosyltransferase involved in cell wall biosynthesis
MRVTAILSVYNEERFIGNCLNHLVNEGVDVYIIDNESTDGTVDIVRSYVNRGVLGVEKVAREGVFRSRPLLARKEELAMELPGDWFVHVDADEIHLAAISGRTLREAFAEVDRLGFNAVNFQEFTFSPTQENPDHDHANYLSTMRWYYVFTPFFPHLVRAWKKQVCQVGLAASGGHRVTFPGLRVFPQAFVMRHYFFLGLGHAQRKFVEKIYAPEEVQEGWYGKRAFLRTELLRLPSEAELNEYVSDDQLRAACPRMQHLLLS